MADFVMLYRESLDTARHFAEVDKWRASHKANVECVKAIEEAIHKGYVNNCLDKDCAKSVIEEYGFNRVNYMLKNTIRQHKQDGRYSQSNKEWAEIGYIPESNIRSEYDINVHPVILNGFVDEARDEWNKLGLFDPSHCVESDSPLNYEGKVLVINPNLLKDQYKTPDFQLFKATSGFGCDPSKMGRKVFGYFLYDDERCSYNRNEFLGVIKDEYLPDWAIEKLKQSDSDFTNDEGETEGIELK